jgi:hypothetical protein
MVSPEGVRINIGILFSKDKGNNKFLKTLGFGSGILSELNKNQMI